MNEVVPKELTSANALDNLLRDPTVVRLVTVLNLSKLSMLEILEYGVTREDINHALAREVIQFDRSSEGADPQSETKGDIYFKYLNNKVRLTELGIYILETISRDPLPLLSQGDPSFVRPVENSLAYFGV